MAVSSAKTPIEASGPGPRSRRRWFTFSLRMMLIVFTAVACLSGYVVNQYRWMLERQAFFADTKRCVVAEPRPNVHSPGLLWVFGEVSWKEVSLATYSKMRPTSEEDLARARWLFPEAKVGSQLRGTEMDGEIEDVYRALKWQLPR